MSNITIQEDFVLPSLGKIYGTPFDPHIKLRSMTVAEEMKRLSSSSRPYKNMADIIDACLETKLPISAYDMCLGDYQFLLHRLRVVTYGKEYAMAIRCGSCNEIFTENINLDDLKVNTYDDSVRDLMTFELPVSKKEIEICFQTPRDLDDIIEKRKALKKQNPNSTEDQSLLLTLFTIINSIDGHPLNETLDAELIKSLPQKDSLTIQSRYEKLNQKVGVDNEILTHCPECGEEVLTTFRFTSEFFRPTID